MALRERINLKIMRAVAARGLVERRDAHQAVHAVLRLGLAEGVVPWVEDGQAVDLPHHPTRSIDHDRAAGDQLAQAFAEYTPNLEFADALLQLGVPKMLTSLDALELYASGAHYVTDRIPEGVMSSAAARHRSLMRRRVSNVAVSSMTT